MFQRISQHGTDVELIDQIQLKLLHHLRYCAIARPFIDKKTLCEPCAIWTSVAREMKIAFLFCFANSDNICIYIVYGEIMMNYTNVLSVKTNWLVQLSSRIELVTRVTIAIVALNVSMKSTWRTEKSRNFLCLCCGSVSMFASSF